MIQQKVVRQGYKVGRGYMVQTTDANEAYAMGSPLDPAVDDDNRATAPRCEASWR